MLGVVCAFLGVVLTLRPFTSLAALVLFVAGISGQRSDPSLHRISGLVLSAAEHGSGPTRGAVAQRALHPRDTEALARVADPVHHNAR